MKKYIGKSAVYGLYAGMLLVVVLGTTTAQESPPAGDLPWLRGPGAENKPKDLSPREMLTLLGIDESHWDQVLDGRALVSDENETLTKLLFRMPRFDPPQWERWCQTSIDPAALVAEPAQQRGAGFLARGRARHVETIEILPELVPLYEFRKYYRVTIAVDDSPHPIIVCTRTIPALWKGVVDLDEPVLARGLFLKAGETTDEQTPLYFVAARLGWFPDRANEALGITEDLVWLARQGMDVALWDEVRQNNVATIGAHEGECFYQLLATLKGAQPAELAKLPALPFNLPEMLTASDKLLGRTFHCLGTARRVQKVSVPEQFRARLGLDHYYEIDLFVPIDLKLRLKPAPGQKEALTYTDGFPTTFNVIELPDNLKVGENVHETVQLKGVFFKLWTYESEYTQSFNKQTRQPSPLLMGFAPQVVPSSAPSDWDTWGPTALMGAVILGVFAVWFVARRTARGDKQFERKVLRKYTHGAELPQEGLQPPPAKQEQQE